MPNYDAENWPPLEIPQPEPQLEEWQVQAPPTPPNPALPPVTAAAVSWQPAAPIPNTTTYLSMVTTQVAIDEHFSITDRRLLPASTTLDANGDPVILAPPL